MVVPNSITVFNHKVSKFLVRLKVRDRVMVRDRVPVGSWRYFSSCRYCTVLLNMVIEFGTAVYRFA